MFINGMVLLVLFSINEYIPLLDTIIFRQYFIAGLNPVVPLVLNFFLLFSICIAFKIANGLKQKNKSWASYLFGSRVNSPNPVVAYSYFRAI